MILRLVHVLVTCMQKMIKGMTDYISTEIARLLSLTVSTVDGTNTSIEFYYILMDKIGTKLQYDLYAASLALQTTLICIITN